MAEGKVDAGHRGFNLIIIKTDALAEPNADARVGQYYITHNATVAQAKCREARVHRLIALLQFR